MAQNHNSSRSNRTSAGVAFDGDADDDGVDDGTEEDDEELGLIYEYLGGEAMVAERFTVCLPDAEVPGGNGSIEEAVTPERLLSYLTGETDAGGRVYSWGTPKTGPGDSDGGGDCDDDDPRIYPAVCGTTPHFVADVTGPVSTGGSLEVVRAEDGAVFLQSGNRASTEGLEMQVEMQMTLTADPLVAGPDGDGSDTSCSADDEPCGPGVWARTTESGSSTGVSVYQLMVQPPRCPEPFPALFYVQRCESDGQLVYTGGWVIDDAALYEGSFTVLSMADAAPVVGIDSTDLTATFEDVAGGRDVRRRIVMRRRRGARLDMGPIDELVEREVLSEEGKEANDSFIRKKPGGRRLVEEDGYTMTHLAVDAPVLHLVDEEASNEVKFKAGAELSGQVN
ncbi:hypothetical protein [Salinigranum salinum]|uniref:hypothetical protein n=1 Tax=Salinigranum salinum TaxID=1364937 RepID=UPI001F04C0CB|nr:hypothetical protein [Salinigranum salinum]